VRPFSSRLSQFPLPSRTPRLVIAKRSTLIVHPRRQARGEYGANGSVPEGSTHDCGSAIERDHPASPRTAACEFGDGQLICAQSPGIEIPSENTRESLTMRDIVMFLVVMSLGLSFPLIPARNGQDSKQAKSEEGGAATTPRGETSLRMTPGVVCRSIAGYEDYETLPEAAQTAEEKLLVYFRPLGHRIERVDDFYQAHLVPDFQIRKRGEKTVLRQKLKFYEYKPKSTEPPRSIYMKNVIALKGLAPGDYDLTIILHDEIAKGPSATQVVKFRIIPPIDVEKAVKEKAGKSDD
jgi:hypothetical protein